MQIASFNAIAPGDRSNDGAYQDITIGSMSVTAGLDGLDTYILGANRDRSRVARATSTGYGLALTAGSRSSS